MGGWAMWKKRRENLASGGNGSRFDKDDETGNIYWTLNHEIAGHTMEDDIEINIGQVHVLLKATKIFERLQSFYWVRENWKYGASVCEWGKTRVKVKCETRGKKNWQWKFLKKRGRIVILRRMKLEILDIDLWMSKDTKSKMGEERGNGLLDC